MSLLEYLLKSISLGYLKDIKWHYTFLTILVKPNYSNDYIELVNEKLFVKIDDVKVELDGFKYGKATYRITDVLVLPKNTINNSDQVKTSLGLVILNYILLYNAIGDNVKYINKPFNVGSVEDKIGELLNEDKITVKQYKKFTNSAIFLEKFSRIVTVSATEKNITPPDGLSSFKTKTTKEFAIKYGPKWYSDPTKVVEYEETLKDFYNAYVEDDPSNGVFLSGKIKNNAGLKKYLTFGLAMGMQGEDDDIPHVEDSLLDGYPKDRTKLAAMYDTARFGSYNRGFNTQQGGAAAKVMLRATSSIVITKNDCKVNYGKKILVTDGIVNALVSRYIIINGKSKLLESVDDVNKYIGKVIEIRSPQYCKSKGTTFCRLCSGEQMSKYEKGSSLVLTDISNTLLYIVMAKMHDVSISSLSTNPIDGIR